MNPDQAAQRPPPDDDGFSEPAVPKPTPVVAVDTAPTPKAAKPKPEKQPKAAKPKRATPAESEEDEGDDKQPEAQEDDGKPKPGERGHPLVGNAEPLAPTPTPTSEDLNDLYKAQRAKKRGIRLKRALKEFPEIQELIDENEALKARLAELT